MRKDIFQLMKGTNVVTLPWIVLKSGEFIQPGDAYVRLAMKVLSALSPCEATGRLLFLAFLPICQASNLCSYPAAFRRGNHQPGLLWLKWSSGTWWWAGNQQRLGTGWCKACENSHLCSRGHFVYKCCSRIFNTFPFLSQTCRFVSKAADL